MTLSARSLSLTTIGVVGAVKTLDLVLSVTRTLPLKRCSDVVGDERTLDWKVRCERGGGLKLTVDVCWRSVMMSLLTWGSSTLRRGLCWGILKIFNFNFERV